MSIQLHNGDALDFMRDMKTASVDVLMTDPPYSSGGAFRSDRQNDTSSKYQNTGTTKEYPNFSGDNRDQLAYYYWSALWIGQCARILKPGAAAFVFTDWRQMATTINAFQVGGLVWRGIIPWNKTEAARPTRGRFRAQCEYVIWGSNGEMAEKTMECMPGFFTYPVKPQEKKHVTEKPFSLILDLLKVVGDDRVTVFDPFMGSGTTGEASVQLGHSFVGCEVNPEYFAIAQHDIMAAKAAPVLFTEKAEALEQAPLL